MVKAYKGFNKDMTCKGFQYEEGTIYKMEGTPELCNSGFHACLLPLDCLRYYRPDESVYHEVELFGEIVDVSESDDTDSKICASMIEIGRKLTIREMIEIHTDIIYKKYFDMIENSKYLLEDIIYNRYGNYIPQPVVAASAVKHDSRIAMNGGANRHAVSLFDRCVAITNGELATTSAVCGKYSIAVAKSDDYSISIAKGCDSMSIVHGDYSESVVHGVNSIAVNNGFHGLAMAFEDNSISVSKGDESKAITNQGRSVAVTTKSNSISKTKGNRSTATNISDFGKAFTEASYSIAAVNGYDSKSKCQASYSIAVARGENSTSLTEDTNSISVAEDQFSKSVACADKSVSVSNGCESISTSDGDFSASVSIGEAPSSFAYGKCSISSAVGELSSATTYNKNSIAISLGKMSKCKGTIGSYIVLTELDDNNEIICVKVVHIDGKKYKSDVWYTLKNKKVVEFDGTLPTIECMQQNIVIDESAEYIKCR